MKRLTLIILLLCTYSCSRFISKQEESLPVSVADKIEELENVKTLDTQDEAMADIGREIVHTIKAPNSEAVSKYCDKIDTRFSDYGWNKSFCDSYNWLHVRDSVKGDPLLWTVFGDEESHKESPKNVTIFMCGVHGDEITPIKFCFDILHHLTHLSQTQEGRDKMKDNLIVIAPIVSPDSFFIDRPSRTNARGVDVNRNFPTKDWKRNAVRLWKQNYRGDKRRNPGKKPLSEPETLFQVNLIKRYNPNKIISVHAPLTLIDYDGPTMAKDHLHDVETSAENLLDQMSKKAKGYTVKNYPFFPGSLGNYAGNERGIPTITLELPTSDNRKHKEYWNQFRDSIDFAIFHATYKKSKIVLNKNN